MTSPALKRGSAERVVLEHSVYRNKVKLLPSKLTKGNTAILGAGALIWNSLGKKK